MRRIEAHGLRAMADIGVQPDFSPHWSFHSIHGWEAYTVVLSQRISRLWWENKWSSVYVDSVSSCLYMGLCFIIHSMYRLNTGAWYFSTILSRLPPHPFLVCSHFSILVRVWGGRIICFSYNWVEAECGSFLFLEKLRGKKSTQPFFCSDSMKALGCFQCLVVRGRVGKSDSFW